MGSIPNAWDTAGVQPAIYIRDWDDSIVYTWESEDVVASETKDFDLYDWQLGQGVGTNFGMCRLLIHDHDNLFTDTSSARRPSLIKNEYRIDVHLGKDAGSLTKWFQGRIREGGINRGQKQQYLEIFATGHGTHLADRYTKMNFHQATESDGITIDSTDTNAKVSTIASNMLANVENYLNPGLGTIGFTTTGIDDIDVKLASFDMRPATPLSVALNEVFNSGGAMWGIDYNSNDIYGRLRGSSHSGILVTNNLTSNITTNWDADKLCLLLSDSRQYSDSTIGYAYPYITALGALHPTLDWNPNPTTNATFDLSSTHYSFSVTPEKDNVWIVSAFLVRNGTPSKDLHMCLIGGDASGEPDPDNLIERRVLPKERLQDLSLSGEWVTVEFNRPQTNPHTKIFLYFEKYGDAVNNIDLDYVTGSGEYWTSATGAQGSYTSATGEAKIRTYHSKSVAIHYMNCTLNKTFGNVSNPKETVITTTDIHQDAATDLLIGLAQSTSRQRRRYKPIMITPPKDRLELGKTVTLKDKFNGMDIEADILSYSIHGNAYNISGNGVHKMMIEIEEPFTVL